MGVLSALEPKEVFYYFEELSKIPHESFNTKQISDYCVKFAQEHGLEYIQDEVNNVIIKKPGTPGYENSDPVVLQGHMDMVCVKTEDSDFDFDTQPLELFIDGNLIGAKNTTLGGDDGIALAYSMALLASTDIPHPPLEAVFTVDEEKTMGGADFIDISGLKGKICVNLDSEEEGIFTVGCAGGFCWNTMIPITWSNEEGTEVTITISGLLGGHSGMEINKQRGNANKLMGRVLYALSHNADFNIITTDGGVAVNAITMKNVTKIVADPAHVEKIKEIVEKLKEDMIAEFGKDEPNLSVAVEVGAAGTYEAMDAKTTENVTLYLYGAPDEVQCYSREFPGAPETSLNNGIVKTDKDVVTIGAQIRSHVVTKLDEMKYRLAMWCDICGASHEIVSAYPAWEYDPNSVARPMAIDLFKEMFGKAPTIENTHGGLECGILFAKKPDLDIISFGPNLLDVHSFNERMDIASTARMWEFLKEFLKRCK